MINLKKILLAILVIGVLVSSAGCKQTSKDKINVACFPNITHSQALYGMSEGDFENALGDDIDINWFTFNAGPSELEAIRSGNIDIGYIGPTPAITGYKNLKIIAGVTSAGSLLVAAKNSGIKEVSDLKGKTVAVPQFGNTQDIILRMLLNDEGIKISDGIKDNDSVEIIQQENANIKALLIAGQIDAALVPEPWGSRLEVEADAEVVLDYDEVLEGNYSVAVLVANVDYLEKNRDTVKKFLIEHIAITNKINENVNSAADIVNKKIMEITGVALNNDVLTAAYGRLDFSYTLDMDSIKKFLDVCIQEGLAGTDADVNNFVDMSLLQEVLDETKK